MSISKRIEDELHRTEPSEFEEERPEYRWPDEQELQLDEKEHDERPDQH